MTTTELLLLLIIGLLSLVAGLIIGWDMALASHRRARKALETEIDELETRIHEFNRLSEDDPQRAWLNLGQTHVLNEVDTLLHRIRNRLETRP